MTDTAVSFMVVWGKEWKDCDDVSPVREPNVTLRLRSLSIKQGSVCRRSLLP